MREAPEKTMRSVETLARHFDKTRESDKPVAITPDSLLEVESIDQTQSHNMASHIPPHVAPVATQGRSVDNSDSTAKKVSDLAYRVLGAERKNEQRLVALTKVLTALANRLQISGDSAAAVDMKGRDGLQEDMARPSKAEMVFWESIKVSENPDDYKSYLESFPDGLFASLARRRAARETMEEPGEPQPSPDALSRPLPRRPPTAYAIPKLDYDILNEQAIVNTKRRPGGVALLDNSLLIECIADRPSFRGSGEKQT